MSKLVQTPGMGIRNFHALLRGQAKLCRYKVKCSADGCDTEVDFSEEMIKDHLVRGIADSEILADLLRKYISFRSSPTPLPTPTPGVSLSTPPTTATDKTSVPVTAHRPPLVPTATSAPAQQWPTSPALVRQSTPATPTVPSRGTPANSPTSPESPPCHGFRTPPTRRRLEYSPDTSPSPSPGSLAPPPPTRRGSRTVRQPAHLQGYETQNLRLR